MTIADARTTLPASIPALLRERCARYADRPAFIAFGSRLSYARLLRDAETFAAWLQAQGIRPGDRVGILLPNCLAFPVAAFGTLLAGAVLAPLNPLYTPREIADALHRLKPSLIVASPFLAASLPTEVECPVILASIGDCHGWKAGVIKRLAKEPIAPTAWTTLASLLKRPAKPHPVEIRPDDLAMLQATGGSTGASKYARLTQANLLSACQQLLDWGQSQLPPETRAYGLLALAALPLYHAFGFIICLLQGTAVGGCSVLIADARRLGDIAAAWRRYPIELFPGVNTLFRGLLTQPAFLRALRQRRNGPRPLVPAGGMPLAEATATAWKAKAGYPILQGYGLTETTSIVSCTEPDLDFDGCVGRPLADTQARICGPDGQPLALGEIGELQVKGGQVSSGYWDELETESHTDDGWFRTGDLASQEADGRLRLMGRLKELVIVSGFNVYPAEIEAYVQQHPDVAECAVTGVHDERTGEGVLLFVVLRPGGDLADVERFARDGLAAYKRPRRCIVVDTMPKTPVGKILKTELARMAA